MENSENYRVIKDDEIVRIDATENVSKRKKESLISRLVYSALLLLVGVAFVCFGKNVFDLLGYIVGGMLLLTGLTTVIVFFTAKSEQWIVSLVAGIIEAVLGIFCIAKPKIVADFAIYVFALIVFISGIVMLYFGTRDKKNGYINWKPILIFGVVLAVLGGAMLLFVSQSKTVIAVMVGISFIVTAILHFLAVILR